MRLSALLELLEMIAPTALAEPWDNVGLLAGDPAQVVRKVMLTIDYTREVAEEAAAGGSDVVISYHPPIFDALKRITAGSLIYDAIRRGVAIYSPHTALDIAEGGTNDMLADAIGLAERRPLRMMAATASQCKLVVFVPPDAADKLATALFAAGAGRIGNYSCCSFRSPGTGTFFGQTRSNPAVGRAGQLERVDELRLETVVSKDRIEAVVRALRSVHPYEEPAFDLVELAAPPAGRGQGRIGVLPAPIERAEVFARIKRELGVRHLLISGPATGPIARAAACAGSCGDLINDALGGGAELYLTGEVRHHDALRAAQCGMTVVCTLHSNSERAVLGRVRRRIREAIPEIEAVQSERDRDPFEMV